MLKWNPSAVDEEDVVSAAEVAYLTAPVLVFEFSVMGAARVGLGSGLLETNVLSDCLGAEPLEAAIGVDELPEM